MDVTLEQTPQTCTPRECDAQDLPEAETTFVIAARTDHPVATGFAAYLEQHGAHFSNMDATQGEVNRSITARSVSEEPASLGPVFLSPAGTTAASRLKNAVPKLMLRVGTFSSTTHQELRRANELSEVVFVFLDSRNAERNRELLDSVEDLVGKSTVRFVGIVSTFRVHFGDRRAVESESLAVQRFEGNCNHVAVFRASHILAEGCPTQVWLQRFSFLHAVIPGRFKSCCIDADELFDSLTQWASTTDSKPTRTYTLLGLNKPWKDWLAQHQSSSVLSKVLVALCTVLKFLCVGQIAGLIVDVAARFNPILRRLNFDTLRPKSTGELLTLYNPYNYRHVKLAGYNNGVVHFGWRFAGRTIVSTMQAASLAKVNGSTAKLDAGVTIRRVRDVLSEAGKELYVIPNYSYVSIGTSFFIPIHGSASRYSTVGDTIDRVLLYDPKADSLVAAERGEPVFEEYMYNLDRPCLLLRLYARVKDKSAYYVKSSTLQKPSGEQVLEIFDDTNASNIELRKSSGDSETVQVCRYYTQIADNAGATGDEELLEVPRDAIGRIWDKLEENALASALHHFFVRKFAYHVELFFSRDEFVSFWNTHSDLPIKKIQLRYIKCDGLRHSPFRDHDCISADLFTFKKHRDSFQAYLRENLPGVQVNPGKHSM